MNSSMNDTNLLCLPPETIWLEPEHFQQAVEISSQVVAEPIRWQVYLQALALLGFEEWWRSRWADIPLSRKHCSLFEPGYATAIAAVCNLLVGEFKLCLIAIESPLSDVIVLPRAVIDLPEFTAHFYIAVEVQEEQEQVIIQGFLRYDKLISYRQLLNLNPTSDWNYHLPLSLFEVEVNRLVFNLRFLAKDAINLPAASVKNSPALTENQLADLLNSCKSPHQQLWESLTWEQGAIALTYPKLLELIAQQRSHPHQPISLSIKQILTLLTQTSINVAKWLQGEIDELAQSLGIFLPQVSALRLSSEDRFAGAIADLRNSGMEIPDPPIYLFQDIDIDEIHLRLCAVTWSIDSELADAQQWALLLILGTQIGNPLPDDLKLQVSNFSGILREPVSEFDDPFLYVRVEGKRQEKFLVTIMLPDKPTLVLNPYTFDNI